MSEVTHMHCGQCGVAYCMPTTLYNHRHADGETFYCPNGHPRCFRPTADQKEIERLEGELRSAERRIARLNSDYDDLWAAREDLIGALKECPGQCGWRSRKQIPRDPVGMGRGIERVRRDIAEHLVEAHGARAEPILALPERT